MYPTKSSFTSDRPRFTHASLLTSFCHREYPTGNISCTGINTSSLRNFPASDYVGPYNTRKDELEQKY